MQSNNESRHSTTAALFIIPTEYTSTYTKENTINNPHTIIKNLKFLHFLLNYKTEIGIVYFFGTKELSAHTLNFPHLFTYVPVIRVGRLRREL